VNFEPTSDALFVIVGPHPCLRGQLEPLQRDDLVSVCRRAALLDFLLESIQRWIDAVRDLNANGLGVRARGGQTDFGIGAQAYRVFLAIPLVALAPPPPPPIRMDYEEQAIVVKQLVPPKVTPVQTRLRAHPREPRRTQGAADSP
jgi:hypothetical protein